MGKLAGIDRTSDIALIHQIRRIIRAEIADGTHPAGSKLPTLRELAEYFDVSLGTVRQVMSDLAREGLVEPIQGSGTYVRGRRRPGGSNGVLRVSAFTAVFGFGPDRSRLEERFRAAAPEGSLRG